MVKHVDNENMFEDPGDDSSNDEHGQIEVINGEETLVMKTSNDKETS